MRLGCDEVRTNLDLLAAARAAHPDAYIVYKPHPDVVSRNRRGRVALREARRHADHGRVRAVGGQLHPGVATWCTP
ncbi:capsular polysaccharide export protein [Bordetella pertussis]|nr:capsular polysaccharide export protein [Bordetella pertussis]